MFDDLTNLLIVILLQGIPTIVLSIPLNIFLFIKKRIKISLWEYFTIFTGALFWFILLNINFYSLSKGKSLSNGIGEPIIIGLIIGVINNIAPFFKMRFKNKSRLIGFIIWMLSLLVSFLVYCFFPDIPE